MRNRHTPEWQQHRNVYIALSMLILGMLVQYILTGESSQSDTKSAEGSSEISSNSGFTPNHTAAEKQLINCFVAIVINMCDRNADKFKEFLDGRVYLSFGRENKYHRGNLFLDYRKGQSPSIQMGNGIKKIGEDLTKTRDHMLDTCREFPSNTKQRLREIARLAVPKKAYVEADRRGQPQIISLHGPETVWGENGKTLYSGNLPAVWDHSTREVNIDNVSDLVARLDDSSSDFVIRRWSRPPACRECNNAKNILGPRVLVFELYTDHETTEALRKDAGNNPRFTTSLLIHKQLQNTHKLDEEQSKHTTITTTPENTRPAQRI